MPFKIYDSFFSPKLQAAYKNLARLNGGTALCYLPTEGDRPEQIAEEPLVAIIEWGAAPFPIVRDIHAIEAPDGEVFTANGTFGNRKLWIEHIRSTGNQEMLTLTLVRAETTAPSGAPEPYIFNAITFVRSELQSAMRDRRGLRGELVGFLRLDGCDDH